MTPSSISVSKRFSEPLLAGLLLALLGLLPGCSNLLFYPDSHIYLRPSDLGIDYREVSVLAGDGHVVSGWLLEPDGDFRGTVFHLHGNAENISTHIHSVTWLVQEGYRVLMLDYPGFGQSGGDANLPSALEGVDLMFRWLLAQPETGNRPVYLLGQSLGATIAAYYAAANEQLQPCVDGIVLDAPFASYHTIAREKLGDLWLTWAFQYPASWLLPEEYSPINNAGNMRLPVLVFASSRDPIVPLHHSRTLFEVFPGDKIWHETSGEHIASFSVPEGRQAMLDFLQPAPAAARKISACAGGGFFP